jgi:hypothetical protein
MGLKPFSANTRHRKTERMSSPYIFYETSKRTIQVWLTMSFAQDRLSILCPSVKQKYGNKNLEDTR